MELSPAFISSNFDGSIIILLFQISIFFFEYLFYHVDGKICFKLNRRICRINHWRVCQPVGDICCMYRYERIQSSILSEKFEFNADGYGYDTVPGVPYKNKNSEYTILYLSKLELVNYSLYPGP